MYCFLSSGEDEGYWTIKQFLNWAEYLKVSDTGLIRKYGKAGLKVLKDALQKDISGIHTARNVLSDIISPSAVDHALNRNVDWLLDNIQSKHKKDLEYPVKVYRQYGVGGLEKKPNITIGTIHSVKGGEADCAFLFPDLSHQANKVIKRNISARDAMYRMFYVGITRAKEELVLMRPFGSHKIGRSYLF